MVLRRTKAKKIKREIPFSWALLFISILEISVWSIGVGEKGVQDYFARENSNFSTSLIGSEQVKPDTQKIISLLAVLQERLRSSFQQAHKKVLELEPSIPRKTVQVSTSFTVFLPGSEEQETNPDPANRVLGIVF